MRNMYRVGSCPPILILLCLMITPLTGACPETCFCYHDNRVDCSGRGLTSLPENLNKNVVHLELSDNLFESIPIGLEELVELQTLDISRNLITSIGPDDLNNNVNLITINFSENKFESWSNIDSLAFEKLSNLQGLILSNNNFHDFGELEGHFILSSTLNNVTLSNCSITSLNKDVLNGMPNITTLDLSLNNITFLNVSMKSDTLKTLDLSNSGIHKIHDAFSELTTLQKLKLSYNSELKFFYAKSNSLLYMDATHCGLDSIPRGTFSKLRTAVFRENHIRMLPPRTLTSMDDVQEIDLSHNVIRNVDADAFVGAKKIKYVDLSYNTISAMDTRTFSTNFRLTLLRLSHNYLKEVTRFDSESLKGLVLSNCEISTLNRDSLVKMPSLQYLDLSTNLIRGIPDFLQADELRTLDLSLCRISSINNSTFAAMPKLRILNLKGNRLTSDIRPYFFFGIEELYLSDNTWRCDCQNKDFIDLYQWLISGDVQTTIFDLYCTSPEHVQGLKWGVACYEVWNSRADKAWLYSVILLVMLIIFFCVVMSIRRTMKLRERREARETAHNIAEARERLQRMRQQETEIRMSEPANAPDPRELQTPPSYTEALSMPKLSSSHPSLAGSRGSLTGSNTDLKSGQKRRRRRRKKTASAEDVRRAHTTDNSSDNEHRIYMESDV